MSGSSVQLAAASSNLLRFLILSNCRVKDHFPGRNKNRQNDRWKGRGRGWIWRDSWMNFRTE